VLRAPVVVGNQVLGHVSELVLDADLERLVGYEVELASGTRRFLPAGVARPGPVAIEVASPLHLVEPEYYRRHGVALADAPDAAPLEIDLESGDVVRREERAG
jgi:hypothetical protein